MKYLLANFELWCVINTTDLVGREDSQKLSPAALEALEVLECVSEMLALGVMAHRVLKNDILKVSGTRLLGNRCWLVELIIFSSWPSS